MPPMWLRPWWRSLRTRTRQTGGLSARVPRMNVHACTVLRGTWDIDEKRRGRGSQRHPALRDEGGASGRLPRPDRTPGGPRTCVAGSASITSRGRSRPLPLRAGPRRILMTFSSGASNSEGMSVSVTLSTTAPASMDSATSSPDKAATADPATTSAITARGPIVVPTRILRPAWPGRRSAGRPSDRRVVSGLPSCADRGLEAIRGIVTDAKPPLRLAGVAGSLLTGSHNGCWR